MKIPFVTEIFEVDGRLYDPFYDQMCQFMEWIEDTMKYSFGILQFYNIVALLADQKSLKICFLHK